MNAVDELFQEGVDLRSNLQHSEKTSITVDDVLKLNSPSKLSDGPLSSYKLPLHGPISDYMYAELGDEHGVVPASFAKKVPEKEPSYFGRWGHSAKKYMNYAKNWVDDFFVSEQGILPYFWDEIKVTVDYLPGTYVRGKDKLKKVSGALGVYIKELKTLILDKCLMTGDFLGIKNPEFVKKTVTKHEAYHVAQHEAGILEKHPLKTVEGEAATMTRSYKFDDYKEYVKAYVNEFGWKPITNFYKKAKNYARDLKNSLSLEPIPAYAYATI